MTSDEADALIRQLQQEIKSAHDKIHELRVEHDALVRAFRTLASQAAYLGNKSGGR